MKNSMAVPSKIKNKIIIQTNNSTPNYLPNRNKSMCPHKVLYMNAHLQQHYSCNPQLQTTQLSINIQWLVSKFWYIHTMEYDSSVFKKNELSVYKQYRWILKTFHLCSRNSRMDKNGKNQKVVRRQGNWLGSGRGAFLSDGESHLVLWVCMIVRAHWMSKALCVLLYPISNENP